MNGFNNKCLSPMPADVKYHSLFILSSSKPVAFNNFFPSIRSRFFNNIIKSNVVCTGRFHLDKSLSLLTSLINDIRGAPAQ